MQKCKKSDELSYCKHYDNIPVKKYRVGQPDDIFLHHVENTPSPPISCYYVIPRNILSTQKERSEPRFETNQSHLIPYPQY